VEQVRTHRIRQIHIICSCTDNFTLFRTSFAELLWHKLVFCSALTDSLIVVLGRIICTA